jgi:flagellin
MTVINTNIKALFAQNALQINNRSLTTAMQQLSTGKRINSSADDAAGMAISTRMTQQIQSLDQAVRNAGDAISLIQTTEGATNEITTMLQRMRELSVQAINDTNANDQRGYLDIEFQQLKQQIVQIANNTEWNGFPILNGTAGQQVGPVPVVRATGNGAYESSMSYAAGTVTSTNAGTITNTGTLVKSGHLAVTVDATDATKATAVLTLNDGSSVSLTGGVVSAADKSITFTSSALTGGAGTFVLTSTAVWAVGNTASFDISRTFATLPAMAANDATINGVGVPSSLAFASSDTKSLAGNVAGSAIAKAAAINSINSIGTIPAPTGVTAVVGETIMTGSAMSAAGTSMTGSVTINGYTSPQIITVTNNPRASRTAVVDAINSMSSRTGVVAVDSGSDATGVRLEAADGRNIEVAFNTASTAVDFAVGTGLKQGAQSGSYSLEAKIDTKVDIAPTNSGTISRTGLLAGDFDANNSMVATGARASVAANAPATVLQTGDLVINGVAIPATTALMDGVSYVTGSGNGSSRAASGIAIAKAINSQSATTGVTATGNLVSTAGAATTTTGTGTGTLHINGVSVSVTLAADAVTRAANIVDAINAETGTGVTASVNSTGGVHLTTVDGRNLTVTFDPTGSTSGATPLAATDFGLNITDVVSSSGSAITLYGGVTLSSTIPDSPQPLPLPGYAAPQDGLIHVSAGANGFGTGANFTALGFAEGTYGGKSSVDMSPPRVGRMSFQVGANAGQTISIDLADFGANGPITGAITSDAGAAAPTIKIDTAAGATSVLATLDAVMNNVNRTRATMGAVMNRMEHVIDNLTNVSTNTTQSRSQVEDADYAKASSEMARAQIIAQAATAVLAQANTSQQTVLKLLQ